MELTAADFERIPRENLRVPREEFIAVWRLAEQLAITFPNGEWHRYADGVMRTCRWVACARIPNPVGGGKQLAPAPISSSIGLAHPEAIQAEAQKADYFLAVAAKGLFGEKDFMEGVVSTFEWVWRGSGRPPLDIRQTHVG